MYIALLNSDWFLTEAIQNLEAQYELKSGVEV